MRVPSKRMLSWVLLGTALAISSFVVDPSRAGAVDVGQPAPDFRLPSTFGNDISLSDFRGVQRYPAARYSRDHRKAVTMAPSGPGMTGLGRGVGVALRGPLLAGVLLVGALWSPAIPGSEALTPLLKSLDLGSYPGGTL